MRTYQTLPFSLGRLADADVDVPTKRVIAQWFSNCSKCCLDTAFSAPLRAMMDDPVDILPDGRLHGIVQMSFAGKNCNIETETNFARAQKAKRATAGRSALTCNMAAKHVLAEAKRIHIADLCDRLPEMKQRRAGTHSLGLGLDSTTLKLALT